MASNSRWVVPASLEARRFFVLDVSNEKARDYAYFQAIHDELESGGYEAMLRDLLKINLANFNVADVPQTEGLQEQKKLSLKTEEKWLHEVLTRGYVWESKLGLEDELGFGMSGSRRRYSSNPTRSSPRPGASDIRSRLDAANGKARQESIVSSRSSRPSRTKS